MRRLLKVLAVVLAMSPVVFAVDFRQETFVFEQFDVPGARLTRPFGLNASGRIVGLYRDAQNAAHGFLRNADGTYQAIDYPGAIFTNASALNAGGDIVGRWTDAMGNNHGYLRTRQGAYIQIDPPAPCVISSLTTVVHGINDRRDLAGRCFDASGKELGWLSPCFGVNGGDPGCSYPTFRIFDVPSATTTDAWMVTNTGAVVGDYSDASGLVHGFVWTEAGAYVTFDVPGRQTGVRAMNERGDVTGIYGGGTDRFHGFLFRDCVFQTIDAPSSVNNAPQGGTLVINDSGLMVGGFIDAGGEHGFIAR
jgi:hypothetical protein